MTDPANEWPGSNPNQPPPETQAEHKTGAHAAAATRTPTTLALAATPEADLSRGDVILDYSMATPTDAQLKAAGAVGVCRYLSPLNADGSDYGPTARKVIQLPEYKWHLAQGRLVRKNYEWYEGRMAEGAAAGRQDAYWAATKAWQLDQAAGVDMTAWWVRWIIFSDDQANTPAGSRSGYMQAAQAQLNAMPGGYLADYYGPQTGCQALAADPAITWAPPLWQTCAWSGGVYGGTAAMYQAICAPVSPAVAGCDTNFVMKPIAGGDGPDMTPDQDVKFAQMYDWLRVLNIGLVPPGQVPYEKQGELATRLRSIDTNTVKLPPAVAGLVKQSTDILAAVNAGTVTLTDEQIDQLGAVIAGIALPPYSGSMQLTLTPDVPSSSP